METAVSRMAGPVAIAAGSLMVVGQLVMWPVVDRSDLVGTTQNPVYQAGGVVYLVAFCLLQLTVVALATGLGGGSGRLLRTGALVAASVGTTLLGGDLWYETIVAPWIVHAAPVSLSMPRMGILVAGAFVSYAVFALGWMFFGVAGMLTRTLPWPLGAAFVLAGAVGFVALIPPFGIPLGCTVLALGVWLVRGRAGRDAQDRPAPQRVSPDGS